MGAPWKVSPFTSAEQIEGTLEVTLGIPRWTRGDVAGNVAEHADLGGWTRGAVRYMLEGRGL